MSLRSHHVTRMVKVKMSWYSEWSLGGVLISLSQATEPVGGYTTESVTHDQCDARPSQHSCSNPRRIAAPNPNPNVDL